MVGQFEIPNPWTFPQFERVKFGMLMAAETIRVDQLQDFNLTAVTAALDGNDFAMFVFGEFSKLLTDIRVTGFQINAVDFR